MFHPIASEGKKTPWEETRNVFVVRFRSFPALLGTKILWICFPKKLFRVGIFGPDTWKTAVATFISINITPKTRHSCLNWYGTCYVFQACQISMVFSPQVLDVQPEFSVGCPVAKLCLTLLLAPIGAVGISLLQGGPLPVITGRYNSHK